MAAARAVVVRARRWYARLSMRVLLAIMATVVAALASDAMAHRR
jgi:hypothetical protein